MLLQIRDLESTFLSSARLLRAKLSGTLSRKAAGDSALFGSRTLL